MQAVDEGRQQQIRAKREVSVQFTCIHTQIHIYIHTSYISSDILKHIHTYIHTYIHTQTVDKEKEEGQLFAQKFLDEAAEAIQR